MPLRHCEKSQVPYTHLQWYVMQDATTVLYDHVAAVCSVQMYNDHGTEIMIIWDSNSNSNSCGMGCMGSLRWLTRDTCCRSLPFIASLGKMKFWCQQLRLMAVGLHTPTGDIVFIMFPQDPSLAPDTTSLAPNNQNVAGSTTSEIFGLRHLKLVCLTTSSRARRARIEA